MTAVDLLAQVTGWAVDAVNEQCLGEEYRVAVSWGPQQIPNPVNGGAPAVAAAWFLVITGRNPILTEPRLAYTGPVGIPEPSEEVVRLQVAEGLRAIRGMAAQKLSAGN